MASTRTPAMIGRSMAVVLGFRLVRRLDNLLGYKILLAKVFLLRIDKVGLLEVETTTGPFINEETGGALWPIYGCTDGGR
jgi:hypothetical protein